MTLDFSIDHVQVAMPAGGEAEARTFYGMLVGLPEIEQPPELAGRGGCWFAVGALQLHLGIAEDFRSAPQAHVALRIPELLALRGRLEDAGVEVGFVFRLNNRDTFFAFDPFGNWIEFVDAREARP